jgi:hypothetical protein
MIVEICDIKEQKVAIYQMCSSSDDLPDKALELYV